MDEKDENIAIDELFNKRLDNLHEEIKLILGPEGNANALLIMDKVARAMQSSLVDVLALVMNSTAGEEE